MEVTAEQLRNVAKTMLEAGLRVYCGDNPIIDQYLIHANSVLDIISDEFYLKIHQQLVDGLAGKITNQNKQDTQQGTDIEPDTAE